MIGLHVDDKHTASYNNSPDIHHSDGSRSGTAVFHNLNVNNLRMSMDFLGNTAPCDHVVTLDRTRTPFGMGMDPLPELGEEVAAVHHGADYM